VVWAFFGKEEHFMNVEFINPFLEAAITVLKTMAFTTPKPGKPFLKRKDDPSRGDVSGVIGLTGPVRGSIAVSFTKEAILHVVSNMFGEACKEIDGEVQDAVGELSNMICGDARRALEEKGYQFEAAIPAVITGKGHTITHSISGPSVVMPFTLSGGSSFFVEACFEEGARKAQHQTKPSRIG
jgi:chemotaxis protein CheX